MTERALTATQPPPIRADTRDVPRRIHSVVLCPCPRDALCERCRADLFAQLRGVAARRGEDWCDAGHVPLESIDDVRSSASAASPTASSRNCGLLTRSAQSGLSQ